MSRLHQICQSLVASFAKLIIVVMSVFFLEQVINWDGKRDILGLGITEALMIGAITLAIRFHRSELNEKSESEEEKKHSQSS